MNHRAFTLLLNDVIKREKMLIWHRRIIAIETIVLLMAIFRKSE